LGKRRLCGGDQERRLLVRGALILEAAAYRSARRPLVTSLANIDCGMRAGVVATLYNRELMRPQ